MGFVRGSGGGGGGENRGETCGGGVRSKQSAGLGCTGNCQLGEWLMRHHSGTYLLKGFLRRSFWKASGGASLDDDYFSYSIPSAFCL